jgi:hypothetical protein
MNAARISLSFARSDDAEYSRKGLPAATVFFVGDRYGRPTGCRLRSPAHRPALLWAQPVRHPCRRRWRRWGGTPVVLVVHGPLGAPLVCRDSRPRMRNVILPMIIKIRSNNTPVCRSSLLMICRTPDERDTEQQHHCLAQPPPRAQRDLPSRRRPDQSRIGQPLPGIGQRELPRRSFRIESVDHPYPQSVIIGTFGDNTAERRRDHGAVCTRFTPCGHGSRRVDRDNLRLRARDGPRDRCRNSCERCATLGRGRIPAPAAGEQGRL